MYLSIEISDKIIKEILLAKDTCKVEGCKFETEMGTKLEAFVRVKLYHEQVHTKKEDIGQILEELTQKQK